MTKVLVADDSGVMRKVICRSLLACNLPDVVEAADGAEAIKLFQSDTFDLVITDWNMPNQTGLEVIQEIRASGSQVPIIMVTTESEKKAVLQAIQAGVSDYLTKPFEVEDLAKKIDKFVCV